MFPATALPIASLAIEAEASGTYFDRCDSGYQSIVDALESIGVDSSYSYRKKIAKANGIFFRITYILMSQKCKNSADGGIPKNGDNGSDG